MGFHSGMVDKFQCDGCNPAYYGKHLCHPKVYVAEHHGVSALTEKPVSQADVNAVGEHLLGCSYRASFNDFEILSSASSDYVLQLQENLLISHDNCV